jgi:hypothetical protein
MGYKKKIRTLSLTDAILLTHNNDSVFYEILVSDFLKEIQDKVGAGSSFDPSNITEDLILNGGNLVLGSSYIASDTSPSASKLSFQSPTQNVNLLLPNKSGILLSGNLTDNYIPVASDNGNGLSDSSLYNINGKIGLGTNSPLSKFHIKSNAGEDPLRVDTDSLNNVLKIDANGFVSVRGAVQSNVEVLGVAGYANYAGGLGLLGQSYINGVGVSLPSNTTAIAFGGRVAINESSNILYIRSANSQPIRLVQGSNSFNLVETGIYGSGSLVTSYLKIHSDGANNIVTTRGNELQISSYYWDGAQSIENLFKIRNNAFNTTGAYSLNINNGTNDLLRIYDDGKISIGNNLTPISRLHIRSNAGEDALRIDTDGFNDVFKIYSDGKVYIRSAFGSTNYVMIGINRSKYSYENNDMLITMNTRIYNSLSLGGGVSGAGLLGLDSNWIIDWKSNSRIQQDNTNGLRLINNQASVNFEVGTGNKFILIRRYGIQIGDIDNQANGSFPQYSRYLKFRTSYYNFDNSSTVYNSFQIKALEAGYQDSSNNVSPDSQLAFYANLDGDPENQIFGLKMPSQITTANQTVMKLMIFDGTNYVLKDVEVGAVDSAGTGYRTLRVTN